MKGFLEKLKDQSLEIALGIALTAILGGVVAQFGAILDLALTHPLPLAVLCGGAFLAGVILSYAMGVRDSIKSKRAAELEETERKSKATAKAAELRAGRVRSFKHGSYYDKLLAFYLLRNDVIMLRERAYKEISDWSLFEYQTSGVNERDYFLSDGIREILNEQDELLLFCKPDGDTDEWLIDEMKRVLSTSYR